MGKDRRGCWYVRYCDTKDRESIIEPCIHTDLEKVDVGITMKINY